MESLLIAGSITFACTLLIYFALSLDDDALGWIPAGGPSEPFRLSLSPASGGSGGDAGTTVVARAFPVLHALDTARGAGATPFATDVHAERLELLASRLVGEHWSELSWLTGYISPVQLDVVCVELERERQELRAAVQLVVVPLHPEAAASASATATATA